MIFSEEKYQNYLPHSLKLNHDWATKINSIFFNKPQPKQKHKIVKAEEKEFSEGVILKPNTEEIIGIEDLTGKWKYCSEEIICSDIPFLFSPGIWLEATEENCGYKKYDDMHSISGELCFKSIENNGNLSKLLKIFKIQ